MSTAYCFDRFEVRPVERRLLVDGQPAAIGARAFDLLTTLVENPGRLLTKSELLDRVWPGLVVEEANLHVQVSSLRKLLGPKVIATNPGQGYKLAVAIERASSQPPLGDAVATTPTGDRRHNLLDADTLIGRESEVELLNRLLDQHRLVTAVGTSGIGKTRLAQAVARQRVDAHADGVWWVDLAALHSADQVAPAIAKAAGLAMGGGDAAQQLALALVRRDTMLVLDNCEHQLDSVAALAATLLERVPKLRLLATSLAPLKVAGEQICRLEGLAVPPSPMSVELARCFAAIQLLELRAQAVDHRFKFSDESVGAAIELCRQLDGVALAIEMAAARLPLLRPAEVLARLGDRLRLLRSPGRVAPERHQTLGATLGWSHALLSSDEQAALRRLAVFSGSCRLDAALAVAAGDGLEESAVLDALCGLVDKSLLQVVSLEPPRYRLLETTRLFAVERLKGSADAAATRRRFCRAMADLAVEAEAAMHVQADRPWPQCYLSDYENIRRAFEQACEDGAVEAGADLAATWAALDWIRGDMQNRRVRLPAAAALLPQAQGLARIKLLKLFTTTFATASANAGVSRADAVRELVALCRERGDAQYLYDVLGREAAIVSNEGDTQTADRALAEGRRLERADWPPRLRLRFCEFATIVCSLRGDTAGWARGVQQMLALAEQGGFENYAALMQVELADLALMEGDAPRAVEAGKKALERLHRLGITTGWGYAATCLCSAQVMAGELSDALDIARAALPPLRAVDMDWILSFPLALWCSHAGRPAEAARLIGCSDAWCAAQRSKLEGSAVRLYGVVTAQLEAALGGTEFERLREVGAAMASDEPHRLLRSVLDAVVH